MNKYPFFADHVVDKLVVFPGAGYIELVLENFCRDSEVVVLEDIKFVKALFWPENNRLHFQVTRDGSKFEVATLDNGKSTLHMSGNLIFF